MYNLAYNKSTRP